MAPQPQPSPQTASPQAVSPQVALQQLIPHSRSSKTWSIMFSSPRTGCRRQRFSQPPQAGSQAFSHGAGQAFSQHTGAGQAFSQHAGAGQALSQHAGAQQAFLQWAFLQHAGFSQHAGAAQGSGAQAVTGPQALQLFSQQPPSRTPFRPLNRSPRQHLPHLPQPPQAGSQQAGFSQHAGAAQQAGFSQHFGQRALWPHLPQQAFSQHAGPHCPQQAGFSQHAGAGTQALPQGWQTPGCAQVAQVPQSPQFRPSMRSSSSIANPWLTRAALNTSAPNQVLAFIEE
jgi:hypothetical protein